MLGCAINRSIKTMHESCKVKKIIHLFWGYYDQGVETNVGKGMVGCYTLLDHICACTHHHACMHGIESESQICGKN